MDIKNTDLYNEYQEITEFTNRILRSYFLEGRIDELADSFDDDIVWLGSGTNQKARGKENVITFLGRNKKLYYNIENIEIEYKKLSQDLYMCEHVSDFVTRVEVTKAMLIHKRFTFILKKVDEKIKIMHIHNSVDYSDEKVVSTMKLIKAINNGYTLAISANLTENTYYVINCDDYYNHSIPLPKDYDKFIEASTSNVVQEHRERYVEAFSRESLLNAYRNGEKCVYLEHKQYDENGDSHWIATLVIFTDNPYNDDVYQITLARCINEERQKEEITKMLLKDSLFAAKKANEAKSDFLAKMSHDIRTPMNAVIGMASIAEENINNTDRVKECLDKIIGSSRYLLSLINDILDLSKIESGKINVEQKIFCIRELLATIDEEFSLHFKQKKQEFTISIDEDVCHLYVGDDVRLRQVIENLLSNAHKYTDDGGKISLEVKRVTYGVDKIALSFIVSDNGSGISPQFMDRLFDAFEQDVSYEARSGVGLGLTITKRIVQLMGGKITVKSKVGVGSVFTVTIPFDEHLLEVEQAQNNAVENKVDNTDKLGELFVGKRALLVEDNQYNIDVAQCFLEMRGFDVDVANNGAEAVEKFKSVDLNYYDVIFMDVRMPVMNGYEATRQIRKLDRLDAKNVLIFAMTANSYASDVATALECGMNGHISKPLDFNTLTEMLKKELC